VIAYKELVREATNLDLFKGEAGFCTVTPMANCCKAKGGGHKSRNDVVMRQIGKDLLGMAGAYIKTYGSSYVYSSMYASGAESMSAVGSLAGGVGVGAASESFSIVGFSFQYAAPVFEGGVMVSEGGFMFTGFDPYTLIIMIVIMIVMDMMECDKEEIMLGMKREQDLCHKVGSWCSEKILGSCWEKTEGWCCFPSKLGRIIQEQGREQLGKSWGDAEDPDCGPFTIAELEQLRFDEMDLSEFIEDIIPTGKTEEFLENAKNRATGAIQNYYEAGTPSGAP
jgi:conjugal transfer mating pair stabilization protein TraN